MVQIWYAMLEINKYRKECQSHMSLTVRLKKIQNLCVNHTQTQTFLKLSFAHDMKAIIDLACLSYNPDRAFSQAGYEKKKEKKKEMQK